jgi:hypothetical protein
MHINAIKTAVWGGEKYSFSDGVLDIQVYNQMSGSKVGNNNMHCDLCTIPSMLTTGHSFAGHAQVYVT